MTGEGETAPQHGEEGHECCRPLNQFDVEDGAVVRKAAEDLKVVARRFNIVRAALLAYGMVLLTAAAGFGGVALVRLKDVSEQNRQLLKRAAQSDADSAAGQQFAIDAVNCLRFVIVEHRWVNEQYHEEQAKRLGVPLPFHSPLPQRPTQEEIEMACRPFGGVTAGGQLPTSVPKPDAPPPGPVTTTTKGTR